MTEPILPTTTGQRTSQPSTEPTFVQNLYHTVIQSSHPFALLIYVGFRVSPIIVYLIGYTLFGHNFIFQFIVTILLLSADFWNVKNLSGRLMVGLRWWSETNDLGESIWTFESADTERYVNPIDYKVFWMMLYATPAFWIFLALLAFLKLQFLYLTLVILAVTLTATNALAYTKCDKFFKADTSSLGFFGTMLQKINPFDF